MQLVLDMIYDIGRGEDIVFGLWIVVVVAGPIPSHPPSSFVESIHHVYATSGTADTFDFCFGAEIVILLASGHIMG